MSQIPYTTFYCAPAQCMACIRRRRPRRANARLVYGAVDRAGSMHGLYTAPSTAPGQCTTCIRRRLPRLNHVFVACSKLKHMVNTARMRRRPRRAVIGRRELHSCTMYTTLIIFYYYVSTIQVLIFTMFIIGPMSDVLLRGVNWFF